MKKSAFTIEIPTDNGMLLFNTLNTGLVHLDEHEKISYFSLVENTHEPTAEGISLITQLSNLGYLVKDDVDEFSDLVEKYWAFRNTSSYIRAVIAPTTLCNLRCSYCYEQGTHRSNMSMDTCTRIIDQLCNKIMKDGVKHLSLIWYGGEPLVNWEILEYLQNSIYDFCSNNSIEFDASIVTYGVLLDEQKIDFMARTGFKLLQVTLDGDKDIHNNVRYTRNGEGTFDTIIKNIDYCRNKIKTVVRININKANIHSVYRVIDFFAESGRLEFEFRFAPIIIEPDSIGESERSLCYTLQEFAKVESDLINYAVRLGMINCVSLPTPKFGFCEAVSRNSLLFDPDGDYFFCWEDVGRKELTNNPSYNSGKYERLYDFFVNSHSFHRAECVSCNIFPQCLGGCPRKQIEYGKAPCPCLRYNIKDLVKTYYAVHKNDL